MKPYDYRKDPSWPSFDNVKGYPVEVERLKSMASALRESNDVELFPHGIMFSGSPGTGKTTLAKAFIAATGFTCFIPSECPNAGGLANIYRTALKKTPAIILLDDVDRIVSVAGSEGFVSDESQACLKELLARLDGVEESNGIITVMTTNEYDNLDFALKRSGRVDLHVPINRPNDADRVEILGYYMGKYRDFYPNDSRQLALSVASKCQDMSCADLALIVKDVYLFNYQRESAMSYVELADAFQARIMEINSGGLLKKSFKNDEDMRLICYHEAGHALLNWILRGNSSDICCLQTSDRSFGGWTAPRVSDEKNKYFDIAECQYEIAVCLGGMAAESIVMKRVSVGCNSDIESARDITKMVLGSCLEEDFSYIPAVLPSRTTYTDDDNQTDEYIARLQKKEQEMLAQGYADAKFWITHYEKGLHHLAAALLERGILSAEKVSEILIADKVPKNFRETLEEKL